jgi:polyphosphate glucokinase
MQVLVIDVGGTNVKILASGESERRKFASGPTLTPQEMVAGVIQAAEGWKYDAVSIGYPAPVRHNRPITDPYNLGSGWAGFDFEAAFQRPVRLVNDAAMQALGSYEGGMMLFLGLGTGLGSAIVHKGVLEPMEIAHMRYRKRTFEDYLGIRALERFGRKKWNRLVEDVVAQLTNALRPDYVVLGGGNVNKLKALPPGCRLGDNANAFTGGFRLWDPTATPSKLIATNGSPEQPAPVSAAPADSADGTAMSKKSKKTRKSES